MSDILVIDDDPLFRTLIEAALKDRHGVETAADGHEGYQAALARPPRLIVLDLLMPTWDGVQTLRALRADETLKGVPVVLLTGAVDEPEVDQAREFGLAGLLLKTEFTAERLVGAVDAALAAGPQDDADIYGSGQIPVAKQRFDG